MIWGQASGLQRVMPAKSAYGGPDPAGEQAAFEASLAAEVNFFDTAAMYSAGGSERRLGELAEGKDVVSPPSSRSRHWGALKICLKHSRPACRTCGAARSIFTNIIFPATGWTLRHSWG
jgi:hypothetical protein